MGNYIRGHKYWTDKHEALVVAWNNSGNTQADYTRIHNELRPALNFAAELILNRYFQCPFTRQTDMKKDAVQHVFLTLDKYNPNKVKNDNGAYSFCSMLIKHFYMEELVLDRAKVKHAENMFDYVDEIPEHVMPIQYEQKEEIDYNAVIIHFKKLKQRMELSHRVALKHNPRYNPVKLQREIEMCSLVIEYVEKYNNFTPLSLLDYVTNNFSTKIRKKSIVYWFKKIIGKARIDFESTDKKGKIDSKYSYVQDDSLPNARKWQKRQRNRDMKKKYPEMDLYRYF